MVALVAALVSLVAVGVFGVFGMRTLADSTVGRLAEGQTVTVPSERLPYTATALIGIVDEDGYLTSVAIGVLEPDGVGGSLLTFSPSADAGSGSTDNLAPLNALLQVEGATAFLEGAERLTGLSFDVIEILDQRRFVQLVTPLGDLPATLPITLRDESTGEQWPAGESTLSSASAARALTARDSTIADWYLDPGRAAVWQAVADRVGAGVGSVAPVASDQDLPKIATLDEFLKRLFAASVQFRSIGFIVLDDERIAEQLPTDLAGAFGPGAVESVVVHERSETLLVLGSIAPSRLGAPLDAPTMRLVGGYSEADLEGVDLNRADVMQICLDRLLFAQTNVVSVSDHPGAGAPEITQIRVADPSIVEAVVELYGNVCGTTEVSVADVVVDGVDIEVELGQAFLDELRGD